MPITPPPPTLIVLARQFSIINTHEHKETMSGIKSEQRMPLSKWTRSFQTTYVNQQQQSVNSNNATASCADYLLPALRLACSLADEICKAEESGLSLKPSFDWIDSIVVYSQSNILKGCGIEQQDDDIRVEILPSLLDNADNDSRKVDGTLYSLGIVFYEIFSRGERPSELELKHAAQRPDGFEAGNEDLPVGFDPFHSKGERINLADELNLYGHLLRDYNLSDDDNSVSNGMTSQGDGPRKKRGQIDNHTMCSISVETLKEKGIPASVCDLVANMLDCTNGKLRKDEAYNDMSEVRDDLQLMLDKPFIYLLDQDMGMLSTTGLQIGGTVFGRNAELSTIKDAYRRTVSGDSELVTISGKSGTGKSLLGLEFGKYVLSEGGILLSGKFDQLQQGKPYSALASAFNEYCGILLQNDGLASSSMHTLARQANISLGRDAYHLAKLIPNLASILGLDMNGTHDEGCTNPQARLKYLLCRFVEAICRTFAAPVTLFLDDLQWADPASIEAVNQLLLAGGLVSQNTHFFFLGCYREGGASNCDLKRLCNNITNARSTNIKLDCMEEDTLNMVLSETLCLSPRLTWSLSSVIYHKTKGNPLFVSRLMLSLGKKNILRPSVSRRRWEWDIEKIQSQTLPDDVVMFLTNWIEELSEDVKLSLCVLACFGSSVKTIVIKTLEKSLQKNLLVNLDTAVEEGLLDKKDDEYHFTHDRIQEAAYNMVNFSDRRKYHYNNGMALTPLAVEDEDDVVLLTAVNQLCLAGPEAIRDESQNVVVARLNLRAGKKAIEMSDFVAAFSYFENGISFLREQHWENHYELSLELFDFAAKCALTNGDNVNLDLLSEKVIANGRSYEDRLNVMYFFICATAYSSRLPESIAKGLEILANLGIELRGHESSLEVCVQETKDLLAVYTHDEILNTRRMVDPTMIIAMKILGKLEVGMSQIMPKLFPYVTQRIIQLSLMHGMSPVSPVGFVHLGSYVAKLGDISEGYRYVTLARSLLDRVGSRESAGEVISIGAQVRAYIEPLQATLEYHNEGYTASMASGDIGQAALNTVLICSSSLSAGVNLQTMREKSVEVTNFLFERKMFILVVQIECLLGLVSKLSGKEEKSKYVSTEVVHGILATNNNVTATYYVQKAYVSFIFRSYDDSKLYIEKHLEVVENTWANLLVAHSFLAFYFGLISFWVARKSRDEPQWLEHGNRSKLAFKKWAESSKWTFENKWYLLEAEGSYCSNDFDRAKLFYEKAITSSQDHKVSIVSMHNSGSSDFNTLD